LRIATSEFERVFFRFLLDLKWKLGLLHLFFILDNQLCWLFLISVVVKIFYFLNNGDKETTCVLIMRKYPETFLQLLKNPLLVMISKHSLLQASLLEVFRGYFLITAEVLEIVSLILRLQLLSHHPP
jgi:hypothetical protein